jgi:DnaK suppressor protein
MMRNHAQSATRNKNRNGRLHRGAALTTDDVNREVPRSVNGNGRKASGGMRLETQRRSLLAVKARLKGNVADTADAMLAFGVETTNGLQDIADHASEIIAQDVALSILGSTTGTLEQIDEALQRIEEGNYGHCEECGVKIPPERLEAIPYATRCVQCAAREEAASAQR